MRFASSSATTFAVALALVLNAALANAASHDVVPVKIDILSAWDGLNTHKRTDIHIRRNAKGEYVSNIGSISPESVDDLVSAARASPLPVPNLANLGIDDKWLEARSHPTDFERRMEGRAPNQIALYAEQFTDKGIIQKDIENLYRSMHTDDWPLLRITITFDDHSTIVWESDSQNAFMLPWVRTIDKNYERNYNANISRAIARLLPTDAANGHRFSPTALESELTTRRMYEIADGWNIMDVENRDPVGLNALRANFDIKQAQISDRNYVSSEANGADLPVGQLTLDAELHRRGTSPADISLELPFSSRIEGVREFDEKIVRYEALLSSMPWLVQALHADATANANLVYMDDPSQNPDLTAKIVYVNDASLNAATLAAFRADMHAGGNDRLADDVAAVLDDAILLNTGHWTSQAVWIVLPDRRTILWRYGSQDKLLNWQASSIKSRPCNGPQILEHYCSGAVISADGKLVP
ncbi:MAG TPA: hypothetical protein VHL34_12795 [Rhizomicrobium sp.]|jgi:hypothetical protein|nr:hypothetical protein [Rhizomicrobium sp.]